MKTVKEPSPTKLKRVAEERQERQCLVAAQPHEQSLAEQVLTRERAPIATVFGVIAIVAHAEIFILVDRKRPVEKACRALHQKPAVNHTLQIFLEKIDIVKTGASEITFFHRI